LKAQAFEGVLDALAREASAGRFHDAAKAIMTTDTFPKVATAQVKLGAAYRHDQRHRQGRRHDRARHGDHAVIRLHRCADRGAGLQAIVSAAVVDTLNAVTVDGDTSTSDTLIAFATGTAKGAPTVARANDPKLKDFRKAFEGVLANLAEQIARDGEGARKLVEVVVEARPRRLRRGASPVRSPTRRWSRPRSPERTRTGAAS
jgi:glutamate N-acetyltransferase/amino-acid N-acetyltransferase